MKRLFIALLIIVASAASCKVYAQTVLPPSDFEILMIVAQGDSSNIFDDTLFHSNTNLTGTVMLTLQDTINVRNIIVSMGDTNGGTNLFQKTFTFDNSGTFSDGTSYTREGFNVSLGIGNYTGLNNYYSQVVIQDTSGNNSVPVLYSPNN